MKNFEFGGGKYQVICEYKKTRMAFKHTAIVRDEHYNAISETKICYQNRTWESYEFQSVIHQAIGIAFGAGGRRKNKPEQDALIKQYCDEIDARARGIEAKRFEPVKMVCAFGALLTSTPEERANWDKRMLSTIPGIDFPDDFDQLSVEEQQKRLDAAKGVL
jgi:hypothetical protein